MHALARRAATNGVRAHEPSPLHRIARPPPRPTQPLLSLLPTHASRRSFTAKTASTAPGIDTPAAPDVHTPDIVRAPSKRNKSVEETYKKMSQREHILLRPES